jgi:hypothetical protein
MTEIRGTRQTKTEAVVPTIKICHKVPDAYSIPRLIVSAAKNAKGRTQRAAGHIACILRNGTRMSIGMALKLMRNESVINRCFADHGRDRAHGQGGLRVVRAFARKAEKMARARVPPNTTPLKD